MKRLESLDGLRGVAIIVVMLYHLVGFHQGWIGVDIFFVLSGYLITSILLNEKDEPRFWNMFYVRRVTRILPAFFLMLLINTLAGNIPWHTLWPYIIFSGTNFALLHHQGLLISSGMVILWSLCVEEHFYLLWPLQVRRGSRRTLVLVLSTVIVLEPIARAIATLNGASWRITYYLTPFRIDSLAVGSLLALGLSHESSRRIIAKGASSALAVSVFAFAVGFHWLVVEKYVFFCSVIGYSGLAFSSAALLAYLITRSGGMLSHLLSWAPLVFMGRISYGLYLYHLTVLGFMFRWANSLGHTRANVVIALSVPVSIGVSWLSFRFLEMFFLKWGRKRAGQYREENSILAQVS